MAESTEPYSLTTFRKAFAGWVASHNLIRGFSADAEQLLTELQSRIPESFLRQIGDGLASGFILTEEPPGRGYAVRESDRVGGNGHYTVSHWGDGRIAPCWELYIQLADYSRLRAVADPRGLTVRLEDRQMDITVWRGDEFLLYVENKERESQATALLAKMRSYGEQGFELNDPDKGNDPLRKAKYLYCDACRPRFFAISAIGYEQLFRVEYIEGRNRFRLVELDGPLTTPLLSVKATTVAPPRSVTDSLALEFERFSNRGVWLSPGSGQTALNVYLPSEHPNSIAVGVYKDGRVWTDFKKLGSEQSSRLAINLRSIGVGIDPTSQWGFWKKGGEAYRLVADDAAPIVAAVMDATSASDALG